MKQNSMFKLHRHRTDRSGERVDFRFSHFHATQVPKGWDKLSVSIISVETGKTISKSSKATVRNGNCQWTESVSESIWIPQGDASKELTEYPFKFILAMGSARTSILGEAVVNLADYMGSRVLVPVSLPLKKCSHGTTLQVKIQCRTSRSRSENQDKETSSNPEVLSVDSDALDNRTEESDSTYARSVGSSSSNHLGDSHPGELGDRDISYSASGSHRSSDSGEISIGRTYSPPANNIDGDLSSPIRKQDSFGSQNIAVVGSATTDDPLLSNNSSFSSKAGRYNQRQVVPGFSPSHALAPLSFRSNNSSSKDLLDAAEDTIDELRAEAKMWERNARKLKVDLETLRKELSEQSRRQADLDMEVTAAFAERDGLKMEVDQLKLLLDESVTKQKLSDNSKTLTEDMNLRKEVEDELRFVKESNSDLAQQLQKTQESNLELVSILQEMEETIEKQKLEIENASALQKSEFSKSEESSDTLLKSLEKKLEEKNQEIEHERALRSHTIDDIERQWASRVSEKDEEIAQLQEKMSVSLNKSSSELIKEIEFLTAKLQELEKDCNELTEENLELMFKMKQSGKEPGINEMTLNSLSSSNELEQQLKAKEMVEAELTTFKNKYSDLEHKLLSSREQSFESCGLVEILKMLYELKEQLLLALGNIDVTITRDCLEFFTKDTAHISAQELSTLSNEFSFIVAELSEGFVEKKTEVFKLESSMLLKEEENRSLENSLVQLQQEKVKLEEKLEIMSSDNAFISRCLDDARQELIMIKDSLNANDSNFKLLGEKSVELEAIRSELESHVAELEEENLQLSERILGMEAQLRYLTDEKKSCRLELEESHCALADLRNEVESLKLKLEAQNSEMKQKLQESHMRGAEALEELELSKKENLKLLSKIKVYESEINALREESEDKIKELNSNVSAFQEKEELLVVELEQTKKQLQDLNLKEENHKLVIVDLESKLKTSEYGRQQLEHDISSMRVELDMLLKLQDEIVTVKSSLDTMRNEKRKIEELLERSNEECEEFRGVKVSILEKVSTMQRALVECEEANSQFERKIQQLEQEKEECLRKSLALEEKLKAKTGDSVHKEVLSESVNGKAEGFFEKEHLVYVKHDRKLVDNKGKPQVSEADLLEKVQLLETKLADVIEGSNMYKEQLKSFLSGNQTVRTEFVKKWLSEDEARNNRSEKSNSALEAELKDLRERYFHMSLRFAEVEAEREDLVMKVRTLKSTSGKGWFTRS